MKIRWNRNGVRFRITPPELEALLQNRPVTEDLVLPWGGHWIIGTTDTDWQLDRAHPAASATDQRKAAPSPAATERRRLPRPARACPGGCG